MMPDRAVAQSVIRHHYVRYGSMLLKKGLVILSEL